MKQAYIAGPLFDDHEREYLVKIAEIVESFGFNTFLPHRDAGLVTGDFTFEKKVKVFDVDMEFLEPAELVVALLTGRDVDSCLLYTSPSPRDATLSRMPSSA